MPRPGAAAAMPRSRMGDVRIAPGDDERRMRSIPGGLAPGHGQGGQRVRPVRWPTHTPAKPALAAA